MTTAVKPSPTAPLATGYDEDFFIWTQRQAELLRAGKLEQLDIENLIDEIESLGKRDRRELLSRARVLIAHLLKWQFQPERRSNSWRGTVNEQRQQIRLVLDDSPSLQGVLEVKLARVYQNAVAAAANETGLPASTFPTDCPYSLDDVLGDNWPERI